jgi:TBC1 domain family member 5
LRAKHIRPLPTAPRLDSRHSNQNEDAEDDDDDPLSDTSRTWTALRAAEALRAEIALDVERCMPEVAFFRQDSVQRMLGDALFVWCCENPAVGYRQGMHEVVGFAVAVIEGDGIGFEERPEGDGNEQEEAAVLREILDVRFVEHDVYAVFEAIMRTGRSFYEPAPPPRVKGGEEGESAMILRAKKIFYELLPLVDPELAKHLQDLDVIPQIFLMRWVRLLFGREFPFKDVLEIWDLLFTSGTSLELVDWVCVAMMLRIRWECKS